MFISLTDSPLSKIVNAIDQAQYSITEGETADGSEAYIVTHDESGVRIRVQDSDSGDFPDSLSVCGEDTDDDDWGELSTDPAKAVAEIDAFAGHLAIRQD